MVILTREAGYKVEQTDVEKHLFVPNDYFQGSVEDFWKRLPELDANFEQRREKLAEEGKRWRFVATMDHGKTNVALKEVDSSHPFYNLEGSNNNRSTNNRPIQGVSYADSGLWCWCVSDCCWCVRQYHEHC